MRSLCTMVLLAGLCGLAVPALSGCKESKETEKQSAVVDCKVFCERTFGSCGREVFIKSGKLRVDKAKLFKVLGLLKRVKAEGLEKCHKNCGDAEGVFGDAKQVNACLKIKDCKKYAACITQYIK